MCINKCTSAEMTCTKMHLQPYLECFVSHITWIGDCSTPTTFQQLMTSIFCDAIGHGMHIYLSNIFVYSNTIEEHEEHLCLIFERLRQQQLYIEWAKCNLYADKIDYLSHTIDKDGIYVDADKVTHIREWCTPHNYNDIQCFVGLSGISSPISLHIWVCCWP